MFSTVRNNDIVIARAQSARGNPEKLSTNVNATTILDHHSRAKSLLRDDCACVVIARAQSARGNP